MSDHDCALPADTLAQCDTAGLCPHWSAEWTHDPACQLRHSHYMMIHRSWGLKWLCQCMARSLDNGTTWSICCSDGAWRVYSRAWCFPPPPTHPPNWMDAKINQNLFIIRILLLKNRAHWLLLGSPVYSMNHTQFHSHPDLNRHQASHLGWHQAASI